MARASLALLAAHAAQARRPDEASEASATSAAASYQYNVQFNFASVGGGTCQIVFPGGISYLAYFGGIIGGAGVAWGTAWMNVPIEQLRGTEARCWLNQIPFGFQIGLWAMNGDAIGTAAGGGIAIGGGTGGGQGKFS